MRRLLRSILTIFSFFVSAALLLSVATVYINPYHAWALAILSFGFPILFVLNVLSAFWWIYRKRWQVVIPLLALALTWEYWTNTFQFNGKELPQDHKIENSLKVLTFNVRMLNVYGWKKQDNIPGEIFSFIAKENPDVVCFQEFFVSKNKEELNEHVVFSQMNQYPYRHAEYSNRYQNVYKYGLVTFSKYPIVNKQVLKFESTSNFTIQTDLQVKDKRLRLFNNHLESIRFKPKHFDFLDSLNYKNDIERRKGLMEIVGKLRNAFKLRATQAESVGNHIKNSPYPVIVCGDFNDTPISYTYQHMKGELKDAFVEAGKGFGGTYNGRLPSLRIDYIFYDPRFEAYDFKRHKVDLSDHFPISVTIDLDGKNKSAKN